jgi:hypothetical protein
VALWGRDKLASTTLPQSAGMSAPGTDQGFLNRILGQVRVAEDQPGGCVQPSDGTVDERGEGVMIAMPGPVDELPLIHDRLACDTAWVVVLDRVWRQCLPNRSPAADPRAPVYSLSCG